MDRLSLPATIDSATKINRTKAIKRRSSLRGRRASSPTPENKENVETRKFQSSKMLQNSPGPTPYYVVAAERESIGEEPHSPPLTRSASKKQKAKPLPFGIHTDRRVSRGVVLNFSPPDQEANRRREAQELARKKAEFERRVQRARSSGRLLEFSPRSGRPLQSFDDNKNENDVSVNNESSTESMQLARLVGGQQEAIQNLEGQMNQFLIMHSKSFDENNKVEELAKLHATNMHLSESNEKLGKEVERYELEKRENQALLLEMKEKLLVCTTKSETEISVAKGEVRVLQKEKENLVAKFEEAKESFLVEKTRITSELESTRRESEIRLQGLGESRKCLEEEKQKLFARVEELETLLLHSKDQYTDMKAIQSKFASDRDHLIDAKNRLESEVEKIIGEKKSLIEEVSILKHELSDVETRILPEKVTLLNSTVNELDVVRKALRDSEILAREQQQEVAASKAHVARLEQQIEEERNRFARLDEEGQSATARLEKECAQKEFKIEELTSEIDMIAADLEIEQQNRLMLLEELKVQGDDANKAIEEIEARLDEVTEDLESERKLREEIEARLHQYETEMIKTIQEHKSKIDGLLRDLEGERSQNQQLIESQKEREEEWRGTISKLQNELTRVTSEHKNSLQLSQKAEEKLSKIQKEAQILSEETKISIETLEDKLSLADAEKSLIEEKLLESQNYIKELHDNHEKESIKLQSVQSLLEDREARLEELMHKNEILGKSIGNTESQMKALESSLQEAQTLRSELTSIKKDFNQREDELLRKITDGDRIRRDLHAKVMQLTGNIRVFVRVRPELPGESEVQSIAPETRNTARKRKHVQIDELPFHFPGIFDKNGNPISDDLCKNIIEVVEPPKDRGGLKERKKKWQFSFDNVFSPQQSQDDIWQATEPLVQSAIDGYNVCIFAYGQTGSGKTYTMLGDQSNKGIISRAVDKLFESKKEMEYLSKGTSSVSISVELIEIYNEKVRDLLSTKSSKDQNLKVASSDVEGNTLAKTFSPEEVMQILEIAQSRRCVKATNSNAESSRSHLVFTIHYHVLAESGMCRKGKLHVCDLAGSERLSKSGANSSVSGSSLLQETKAINSSLSVLSNVIEKIQQGSQNVPFRESKLTMLLQNSLVGNSKTLAIVCCNPLPAHFHESLCSLRFADKVNKVDLKANSNFSC